MNWREIGDATEAYFVGILATTPLAAEAHAIYQAVAGDSILYLTHLGRESDFGRAGIAPLTHNPTGLRPRGGDGFMTFATWAEAATEWHNRVRDPNYAYAPTTTIEEYVHVYAPSSDGNDEAGYVSAIVHELSTAQDAHAILPRNGGTVNGYAFGNVPHPPFVDMLVKDVQNGAWDDLGQRVPKGVCHHSMVGSLLGTNGWFRRGVGVSDGLTDYGIGGSTDGPNGDGLIYRWNDPLGLPHPGVSPNRAGWANGGSDGLEGDGPAFVRTLGINAINRDLVSIERSDAGDITTPMSPKQFESICALTAYWLDQAKVPWDSFPLNPVVGCVTDMIHKEFATKDCPFPAVYGRIDELQNRVRAIMKEAQTSVPQPAPVPPPGPVVNPGKAWPNQWSTKDLALRFGNLPHTHVDGTVSHNGFDENGPISNAWVAECTRLGYTDVTKLPKPFSWHDVPGPDSGLVVSTVIFDAIGPKNLTLVKPGVQNAAWRWVS